MFSAMKVHLKECSDNTCLQQVLISSVQVAVFELITWNRILKFNKIVPKIAAGQHLVPKIWITFHFHLAVSYYKFQPQKSSLLLSRKSF